MVSPVVGGLVIAFLVLVTSCGGSPASQSHRSPAAAAPPSTTPSPPEAPVDLSGVAIPLQGVPNAALTGSFDLDQYLQKWSSAPNEDQSTLAQAGFTDGYAAYTIGVLNLDTRTIGDPGEGVVVQRFKSAAGAGQATQAFVAQEKALPGYAQFPVAGVSGAIGSTDRQAPQGGGSTQSVWRVKFTRGPLFFELLTFSGNPAYNGMSQVVQLAQQQAARAPSG
jgi:hypothetical protein